MRRKRLNHAADTFCQIFRGWRLSNSLHTLVKLGSGTLIINAKDGTCTIDGASIETLPIASEVNGWFTEDLAKHRIPETAISVARLTVQLGLSTIQGKQRSNPVQHIAPDGKPIREGKFYRLSMQCNSEIATDEATYSAAVSDTVEWPENWP
jgi:hypothetical protein